MPENHKVLVIVHEDIDFAQVAANLARLERAHPLEVCFIDVLKHTKKNKWLKRGAEKQLSEAKLQARSQQINTLLQFHGLFGEHNNSTVLIGDMVQEVVRMAINDDYDLVIKAADRSNTKKTSGRDLNLLRKCPTPFLLLKPFGRPIENIVASIDIDGDDDELEQALNRRIIDAAINVSQNMEKRLQIMSSWELENESDLRDNPFFKISTAELNKALIDSEKEASNKLSKLLQSYQKKVKDIAMSMALVKGRPQDTIPQFCNDHQVDLLVMGTVARAGLRGLLAGNTAEEILPALECSILAVKPPGFRPPMR